MNATSQKNTPDRIGVLCRFYNGFMLVCIIAILTLALNACNVTRTVTTKSEFMQRGDTSVIIQTKTIESYDGRKN